METEIEIDQTKTVGEKIIKIDEAVLALRETDLKIIVPACLFCIILICFASYFTN